MLRVSLVFAVALGVVAGSSPAYATELPTRHARQITAPTRTTYTVDGRQISMTCQGRGRVPVVFLAGGDDVGASWNGLITALGSKTLTCVFDRPGVGASTPSPTKLTPRAVAAALDATLQQARIGSRYVLVGHSIGGANVLVYGSEHPRKVAGAVLLDPSQAKFFELTHAQPVLAALGYKPRSTIAQIRAVKKWPPVPLIVLSRDPKRAAAEQLATPAQEQAWVAGARRYVRLSAKGSGTVLPGASHYVHVDAPQESIDAIRTVLAKASR
jgi:pimeloyl-ACP methyl ester carboxylesterase